MVSKRDQGGSITNKLIGWYGSVEYEVTDLAFNGSYWECYICHREFATKSGLNQHLNSATHQQKLYHCPNARGGCSKEFTTLAGLFNHLESESCEFMRFEKVQKSVSDVFRGGNLIGFT